MGENPEEENKEVQPYLPKYKSAENRKNDPCFDMVICKYYGWSLECPFEKKYGKCKRIHD